MLMQMTVAGLSLLIVALLIWYFAFDTYLTLNKMKNKMHENTKRLQRQMNWMWVRKGFLSKRKFLGLLLKQQLYGFLQWNL